MIAVVIALYAVQAGLVAGGWYYILSNRWRPVTLDGAAGLAGIACLCGLAWPFSLAALAAFRYLSTLR